MMHHQSQPHQTHASLNGSGQQRQQTSPRSSLHHTEPADSDDGGQSGDDGENDYDDHNESTRPGKRKRPISVSCELCKQRKVKCDRGQPSCGWCSRNGAVCEYKERKKPGLRAGYGRELEQRLDKLEEILRTHSEILQTAVGAQTSPLSRHTGSLIHPNAPPSVRGSNASLPSDQGTPRETGGPPLFHHTGTDLRTPRAETALFLQKPSTYSTAPQGMEFSMPPAPTPGMHDGYQAMAGISPPSLPTGITPTVQEYYGAGPANAPAAPANVTPGQSQISSDQELPPYDLLYALVDLYFKHINTWCPILHRKSTLDSLFGPTVVEETNKILLHAIVATTLRYSTDSRLTDERRRHYHDVSKQRVLLYGMENSSVKSLQALVILALDLCGSSNGPPGWNIMALITRSVVQLGLAVESNSFSVSPNYTSIYTLRAMILPEPRDFIEEESRRRLFWMIYLLDRYATISTAFEFALDDKEIDRTLPCRDDLWIKNQKVETRWFHASDSHSSSDMGVGSPENSHEYEVNKPENLGAFSYYIEILGILSKVHKFLKQPVDISALSDVETWQMRYKELDNMLTSWKFGLPGEYGNMAKVFQPNCSKTLNCGWVMLHATYHTAVIRLHSSAAYPTTRSPIFTPSYSASQRCHQAVENVAALGEFVVSHGLLAKLGPPFAFTLWVCARLLLVHGSTVEHKLSPQIPFFVDTLREMGRHWPVAARYSELLTRVLDEHRDSERQGDGVTPSSVRILSDMRRTAFDLDFLISRQPRHNPAGHGGHHHHQSGQGAINGGGNGGNGATGAWQSRLASVTPARTPAPNELEYLDVFDFFNVPRLPYAPAGGGGGGGGGGDNNLNGNGNGADGGGGEGGHAGEGGMAGNNGSAGAGGGGEGQQGAGAPAGVVGGGMLPGEFNITDFMVDANRDWLFKQEGPRKFMN